MAYREPPKTGPHTKQELISARFKVFWAQVKSRTPEIIREFLHTLWVGLKGLLLMTLAGLGAVLLLSLAFAIIVLPGVLFQLYGVNLITASSAIPFAILMLFVLGMVFKQDGETF